MLLQMFSQRPFHLIVLFGALFIMTRQTQYKHSVTQKYFVVTFQTNVCLQFRTHVFLPLGGPDSVPGPSALLLWHVFVKESIKPCINFLSLVNMWQILKRHFFAMHASKLCPSYFPKNGFQGVVKVP